jgi:hypothetical protein
LGNQHINGSGGLLTEDEICPSPGNGKLKKWLAAWVARVKQGVVEIAAAKSSQQFGREEEKE